MKNLTLATLAMLCFAKPNDGSGGATDVATDHVPATPVADAPRRLSSLDGEPEATLDMNVLIAANAAKLRRSFKAGLILSPDDKDEKTGLPKTKYSVPQTGPGGIRVDTYGEHVIIRSLDSAANLGETKEDFLNRQGTRAASVQVVVFGRKWVPSELNPDQMVLSAETEELLTFRAGLSHNLQTAQKNAYSVSIIRRPDGAVRVWTPKDRKDKAYSEVNQALNVFEAFIRDAFETIPEDRLNSPEFDHLTPEVKEQLVKYNSVVREIAKDLPVFRDPVASTNNATPAQATAAPQNLVQTTTAPPTSLDDLAKQGA